MELRPEYLVCCHTVLYDKYEGQGFNRLDQAQAYFTAAVRSDKYRNVRLYDAVDNVMQEWDLFEDDVD